MILAVGLSATAFAQTPPSPGIPGFGPPMLHLSANATLKVPPDELVADRSAIDTSTSAVIAQRRLNTLMAGSALSAGGSPTQPYSRRTIGPRSRR
jgi:hypothetical protein